MTEIPEHLLRRSRERREALGLAEGEGTASASSSESESAPAAAASSAVATEDEAATPAVAEPVITEPAEPVYVAPKLGRNKIPIWVMPILIGLPLWAFLYPGSFTNHKKAVVEDPLVLGAQVYQSAGCSGCHGKAGEGGVGPALQHGAAKLTFPNIADQVSWVKTGSAPFAGKNYGDPNRPGGQHGPAKGVMPAFGGTLSQTQIDAVVLYEREKL
jgi:mono/diheme cytochrome c family protein